MFLAIDVGNTQTTLEVFDSAGVGLHTWRLATDATHTSDMLHAWLTAYLQKDGIDPRAIHSCGIASVVPALERTWGHCLTDNLHITPRMISAQTDCGMTIRMPYPAQVGADRIANAVAAQHSYGAPAIVVDFGTATNIDVVDAEASYRGGVIAPGLMLSAEALFARAARLSNIPIQAPAHTLGTTTTEAVQSGLVIGAASEAEGLVRRIKEELDIPQAPVIGTGGLARTVSRATDLFDVIDPDLTLRGIREITLYQSSKEAYVRRQIPTCD